MNFRKSFLNKSYLVLISFTLNFIVNVNAFAQSNSGDFVNSASIIQELNIPVRTAIDNKGSIFVTDASQKCIVQFDSLWNYIGKIYIGVEPTSIAISGNNTMFVGDYHNGKIYKRLSNGTVSVIYSDTIFPSAMVVSPVNELYVVDSRSKRVLVMNFTGTVLRTFGSGVFLFPTGIAFDSKNNRVIVSEHGGFGNGFNLHTEIRIFSTTGNLISTFGGWGNSPGKFYRVQGLTVGRCGNIYVTDPYQGNISVFNENGTYLTKFGIWGDSLGNLNVPMDMAFDLQERVYVVSLNNSALEVFNITDLLPSSTITTGTVSICEGSTAPIKISFTGTAPWTFTYTINGTNPHTVTNTFDNPYTLNASIAGAYNVTALSDANSAGTCFSNTAYVILSPVPTSAIANINSGICQGESTNIPVTFTGNAPWRFTYTISGLNPTTIEDIYANPYSLEASLPGTYEIIALSGSNCAGTVFTGSATVSINPAPESTILTGDAYLCAGTSATIQVGLTGTAPWSLTYTKDDQNPVTYTNIATSPFSFNAFDPGTYRIVALSDSNCNGNAFYGTSVITEHPLPESNFISGNPTIFPNDSALIAIDLKGTAPWLLTYTIDGANPTTVSDINSSPYTFYVQQPGVYEVISLSDAFCNGTILSGSSLVSISALTKTLDLIFFLQGLYNGGGTMIKIQDETGNHFDMPLYPSNAADLVTVELHEVADYSIVAYTVSNVVLTTTGTVSLSVPSALSDSYFITLKHRNSIETTTAAPVSFSGGLINYSFDTPLKVFGGNLFQTNDGVWAIYGGDVNQDGVVDAGDMVLLDNDNSTFAKGYLATDINGDGIVDVGDMTILDHNSASFVSRILP